MNDPATDALLERKLDLLRRGEYDEFKKLQDAFHQKTSGVYIGDVVFAANDGIVTTFAVVAGATGGELAASAVLILGFANLFADGLSMGLGNYLGVRSVRDYAARQRHKEAYEIETFRPIEVAEVEQIFRKWGFTGESLREATEIITSDKQRWIDFMMRNELDIIEQPAGTPERHGLVTFVAFALAGLLPLIPYLLPIPPAFRFPCSIASTALALFVIGALRTLITARTWLRAGLEMLAVGSVAAAAAYGIGALIRAIVSGA